MSKRKLPRRFSINKLEDIEGSYILNSPRLKKACKEIGVKFKEVFPIKKKSEFLLREPDEEVAMIQYKNYNVKMQRTINSLLKTREKIIQDEERARFSQTDKHKLSSVSIHSVGYSTPMGNRNINTQKTELMKSQVDKERNILQKAAEKQLLEEQRMRLLSEQFKKRDAQVKIWEKEKKQKEKEEQERKSLKRNKVFEIHENNNMTLSNKLQEKERTLIQERKRCEEQRLTFQMERLKKQQKLDEKYKERVNNIRNIREKAEERHLKNAGKMIMSIDQRCNGAKDRNQENAQKIADRNRQKNGEIAERVRELHREKEKKLSLCENEFGQKELNVQQRLQYRTVETRNKIEDQRSKSQEDLLLHKSKFGQLLMEKKKYTRNLENRMNDTDSHVGENRKLINYQLEKQNKLKKLKEDDMKENIIRQRRIHDAKVEKLIAKTKYDDDKVSYLKYMKDVSSDALVQSKCVAFVEKEKMEDSIQKIKSKPMSIRKKQEMLKQLKISPIYVNPEPQKKPVQVAEEDFEDEEAS